jgi:hypothetical protein
MFLFQLGIQSVHDTRFVQLISSKKLLSHFSPKTSDFDGHFILNCDPNEISMGKGSQQSMQHPLQLSCPCGEGEGWSCWGWKGDPSPAKGCVCLRQRDVSPAKGSQSIAAKKSAQRQPAESTIKISLNGLAVKLIDGVRIDVVENWAICCWLLPVC